VRPNLERITRLIPHRAVRIGIGLGLASLLTIVGVSVWALARAAPPWWRTIQPADQATTQAAGRIERNFTSILSQQRPDDDVWAFSISASAANAWLNVRLPRWLENLDEPVVWPDALTQLQVNFDGGRIHIGALLWADEQGQGGEIITATIEPRITDGRFACPARSVGVGQLRVPVGVVLSKIEKALRSDHASKPTRAVERRIADDLLALLRDDTTFPAAVRLDDGREVEVLAIELVDGDLICRCQTRWPD
jgi:hypothetical protein